MSKKRMNREKIIEGFETFRNLCLNIMTEAKVRGDDIMVKCYRVHHDYADNMIVDLGGESTKDIIDEIEFRWKELDEEKKNGSTGNL